MADQVIVLGHPFCCESKSQSDSKWKTFGNRNNNDCNGDDKNLKEGLALELRTIVIFGETGKKFDENNDEQEKTCCTT
jgi:hypothetical protein